LKSFVFISFEKRRLTASSVQCLANKNRWSAERVMHEYFHWLPQFFSPLLTVWSDGERIVISLLFRKLELLAFRVNSGSGQSDRQVLNIVGGILSARGNPGRFEFVEARRGSFVLTAVREFHPRLPWYIYPWTQAKLHVFIMHAFEAYLMRRS
jgi:hypothetical protein